MSVTVEELGPQHADALRALLTRDIPHNLYLLGLYEEFGLAPREGRSPFAFWGRFRGPELTAVLFVGGDGGLVVPSANDAAEAIAIAEHLSGKVQLRSCLGEKEAVDGVVRLLAPTRPRTSLVQRLFRVSADDLGPFTNPTLRLAVESDLPALLPLAAACVKELLGRDPLEEDPEAYRARVLQRIRGGRTYLLEVEGRPVFKVDVGSRSQHGAELEALYTVPEARGQGHATLSLGQICRHLLSSIPRLTLRIDESNASLAGVARKVGFVAGRLQRLVVVE
jgi:GNAT superfamily N-acetyltransferase